jgi:hypothetical protein
MLQGTWLDAGLGWIKLCFSIFTKYDYHFLLDVIIVIIATFCAKAIIAILQLSQSISHE